MAGTNAQLSTPSCRIPPGKLVRRSEPGVAVQQTRIDASYSVVQVKVLLAVLRGLLHYVFNADALELAVYRAREVCPDVPAEMFARVVDDFANEADGVRSTEPLARMF